MLTDVSDAVQLDDFESEIGGRTPISKGNINNMRSTICKRGKAYCHNWTSKTCNNANSNLLGTPNSSDSQLTLDASIAIASLDSNVNFSDSPLSDLSEMASPSINCKLNAFSNEPPSKPTDESDSAQLEDSSEIGRVTPISEENNMNHILSTLCEDEYRNSDGLNVLAEQEHMLFHEYWTTTSKFKCLLHTEPRGPIRKEFVNLIANELDNMLDKNDNFTKFFVRINFILIKDKRIKGNKRIKKRLSHHMELWKEGKYEELHQIFIKSSKANETLIEPEDKLELENTETEETIKKMNREIGIEEFNKKACARNLTSASRMRTQSEIKGGFLNPNSNIEVKGKTINVFQTLKKNIHCQRMQKSIN